MDNLTQLSDILCSQDPLFSQYDDDFASEECLQKYEQNLESNQSVNQKNVNSGTYEDYFKLICKSFVYLSCFVYLTVMWLRFRRGKRPRCEKI